MTHEDGIGGKINVSFNAYSLDGCRLLEQHSQYID